jgi:hypothetical protein
MKITKRIFRKIRKNQASTTLISKLSPDQRSTPNKEGNPNSKRKRKRTNKQKRKLRNSTNRILCKPATRTLNHSIIPALSRNQTQTRSIPDS